jgi:site-specific DNA-methyltransferase (adenine-specific)
MNVKSFNIRFIFAHGYKYIKEGDIIEIETNKLYLGDCLDIMPYIPSESADLILCDLPYGITSCPWDKVLPMNELWREYDRIIKPSGAIVLTATMKFAIDLINSYRRYFRYDLVWHKSMAVGFANSKRMPMRNHELILVFYKKLPTYNPQGLIPIINLKETRKSSGKRSVYKDDSLNKPYIKTHTNYPKSVLQFSNGNNKSVHPTQKPIDMFEYLVNTYTNPGDLVLDNCIGSGTTAVACVNTGRRFIGIERDEHFYKIARERVKEAVKDLEV